MTLRSRGLSTVVQPHGFEADQPGADPEAIVSSGTTPASTRASRVHTQLLQAGVDSCLYLSDGCKKLGATENLQGIDTRNAGGDFIHVEIAQPLRTDPARRVRTASAIAAGLLP